MLCSAVFLTRVPWLMLVMVDLDDNESTELPELRRTGIGSEDTAIADDILLRREEGICAFGRTWASTYAASEAAASRARWMLP